MPPIQDPRSQDLLAILASRPRKTADLAAALGVSQPTVSRLIQALGPQVIKLGAARATTYARPRPIDGQHQWPLFRVTGEARIEPCGELYSLMGLPAFWFRSPWQGHEFADGLPFFLQDQRPQGFMGRSVPASVPELGLPNRIQDWSDDHVLRYLALRGHDTVGDLVLGTEAMARLQHLRAQRSAETARISSDARVAEFEKLAAAAIGGQPAGSSAGGEQPKFIANVEGSGWTLVKFSPVGDSAAALRWRDLLLAEHHALTTLNAHRIPASVTEIVDGAERRFLQATRFDRHGDYGRSSVLSLDALNNEFAGVVDTWANTAAVLAKQGLISAADVDEIKRIETFAALIGNTDRHNGNLSFSATYEETPPFRLAPSYDMLPMHYAPPAPAEVRALVPLEARPPGAEGHKIWLDAAGMAAEFWRRVADDARTSQPFREIAEENARRIGVQQDVTRQSWVGPQ
jgi:hypothetical protein